MPIVITPTGQFIDSVTGNPVDLPPQRPDLPMMSKTGATSEMEMRAMDQAMQDPNLRNLNIPPMSQQELQNILTDPNMGMEGEMARENIPANMDMGMNSEMPVPMSVVEQVTALMDMGLTEDEALEAIAIERSAGQIQPQSFGQSGQEQQMQQMQPQMSNPGMGALSGVPAGNERPMVMPTPRPEDLMMMQLPSGRDRTYNPRDALNPNNAPNT